MARITMRNSQKATFAEVFEVYISAVTARGVKDKTIATYKQHFHAISKECYVFDFALDRALRQVSDYSCRLNVDEGNPEKKVAEFIHFLPVLAYDGSTMKQVSAQDMPNLR